MEERIFLNSEKYIKNPGKSTLEKTKNPLTKSTDYDTMIIHTVLVCPFRPLPRVDIVAQDGEDVK